MHPIGRSEMISAEFVLVEFGYVNITSLAFGSNNILKFLRVPCINIAERNLESHSVKCDRANSGLPLGYNDNAAAHFKLNTE